MNVEPHPFQQIPSDHAGWDRKHFEYRNRQWSLLVINTLKADCTGELVSSISELAQPPWSSPQQSRDSNYWDELMIMAVPCRLTVDAAIILIDIVSNTFDRGQRYGDSQARSEIRKALGV